MLIKRRHLIKLLGLGSLVGLFSYARQRGIRYPSFGLEPSPQADSFSIGSAKVQTSELILSNNESDTLQFRAYAPEPTIQISNATHSLKLSINNIILDAKLSFDNAIVEEQITGITRHLTVKVINANQNIKLSWHLENQPNYLFASIGDTGGDKELAWCIKRAHQLGARFLLHLGDFHYAEGDYERAIDLFKNAPLPCYISIGNHDFHDEGRIVGKFLKHLGPLNNQFSIGNIRFINLDTAASFLPVSKGQRGQLIQELINDKTQYVDSVVFTHRPLFDPDPERGHDLGNDTERDWLIKSMKQADIHTWIAGHIHILDRQNYAGLDHIIVGQGLGYQDIIFNKDVSRMLIGRVEPGKVIQYQFAKLQMPLKDHCHPRSQAWKDENTHLPQVQENLKLCDTGGNKKA